MSKASEWAKAPDIVKDEYGVPEGGVLKLGPPGNSRFYIEADGHLVFCGGNLTPAKALKLRDWLTEMFDE